MSVAQIVDEARRLAIRRAYDVVHGVRKLERIKDGPNAEELQRRFPELSQDLAALEAALADLRCVGGPGEVPGWVDRWGGWRP